MKPRLLPSPVKQAANVKWQTVNGQIVDFTKTGFSRLENAVAYAFMYVYSGEDQMATLLLGSDDGSMVWVNGLPVWTRVVMNRAMVENEDRMGITLRKGYNRLLVKVEQGGGGWSLMCNLSSEFPVKTSLARPPVDEMVHVSNVEFTGASVSYTEKTAGILLEVKNYGKTPAGPAGFRLVDPAHTVLAEKPGISLPSGEVTKVIFSMPVREAAKILSVKGLRAEMDDGNKTWPVLLPSSLPEDLLTLISGDPALCDDQTRATARQLELVRETYGMPVRSAPATLKGMKDVSDGRFDRLGPVYTQMLRDQLKNIPDESHDTIHVTGHAHMDMNWLWTYPESEKMFHDNIRQAIAFMEKYDDFTMLQSQAAIYQYIERVDPPLFEKVKKYVAEGRFEPVGGMWTEGDLNLTGGEALCRTFLLGQRFFYDHFGRIAHVGWLPDDFGHISQFPQILQLSGCHYYYFMRCNPYSGTFWWTGPDSSRVLCFSGNGYNNMILPETKNEIARLSPEKHRIFVPTGVGDHGGGPTLKDINMIHRLDSTPHYPAVKFTTAERFFDASAKEMEGRPTHRGEMEYIFEGCYTSVAEIKENTRKSEQSMYRAEYISALRWLFGESYPASELKNMWETVAFNQFHDILPGSAIYETYQDAVADHKLVQKNSREIFETGFRHMADEISFRKDLGQPVVVLNMQPRNGKVLVEAEVFSYDPPATASLTHWSDFYGYNKVLPTQGATATVLVRDQDGRAYPAQITGGKVSPRASAPALSLSLIICLPADTRHSMPTSPNPGPTQRQLLKKTAPSKRTSSPSP